MEETTSEGSEVTTTVHSDPATAELVRKLEGLVRAMRSRERYAEKAAADMILGRDRCGEDHAAAASYNRLAGFWEGRSQMAANAAADIEGLLSMHANATTPEETK